MSRFLDIDGNADVDLHCHSNFSDGTLSPEALALRAKSRGVQLWALTDHDQLEGLALAQAAAQEIDLPFVAGVEISVTWGGRTVHIVGLNINCQSNVLAHHLMVGRRKRLERGEKMAAYFESQGIEGMLESALELARQPDLLSRTHFARVLVARGICQTMQEAFDRYLADDRPAYVHYQWPSLAEAIQWIQQADGVAVIAHPARYDFDTLKENAFIDEFVQLGGQALEVVTGSHRPHEYEIYAKKCQEWGLAASRGSDFHGGPQDLDFGELPPLPSYLSPVWHLFQ